MLLKILNSLKHKIHKTLKEWIIICRGEIKVLNKHLEKLDTMSIDNLLETKIFNDWINTVSSLAPNLFDIVNELILSEYDRNKVIEENREKKKFKTSILIFLMCRNSNIQLTKFSFLFTCLLKGCGLKNQGTNILNQFLRFTCSTTLFYETMKSYTDEKEEEFWFNITNNNGIPHYLIDNYALKYHTARQHIESITRICSLLDIISPDIKDLKNLRPGIDYEFKYENFKLSKNEAILLIDSSSKILESFNIIPSKKPKKTDFHCLPQKVKYHSNSDHDVFKIPFDIEMKTDEYLKLLDFRLITSDQQITEKLFRFQFQGYFTNYLVCMGELHSIQVLEHYFSRTGFIFLFSRIQESLKQYNYIQQNKVKEICKTAHFYILCAEALKRYFDKLFLNHPEYSSFETHRKFIFSKKNKNSHLEKLWTHFEDLLVFSKYYYTVTHGGDLQSFYKYFLKRLHIVGFKNYSLLYFYCLINEKIMCPDLLEKLKKYKFVQETRKMIRWDWKIENIHGFWRINVPNQDVDRLVYMLPFHFYNYMIKSNMTDQINNTNKKVELNYFSFIIESEVIDILNCLDNEFGSSFSIFNNKMIGKNMLGKIDYHEKTKFSVLIDEINNETSFKSYIKKKINEFNEKKDNLLHRKSKEQHLDFLSTLDKTQIPNNDEENELLFEYPTELEPETDYMKDDEEYLPQNELGYPTLTLPRRRLGRHTDAEKKTYVHEEYDF